MTMRSRNRRRTSSGKLVVTLGVCLAVAAVSLVREPDAAAIIVRTRTAVVYRPHPVARAAVATTAAVATAVAVGTIVRSLPPSCSAATIGGVVYQQCGGTWYQPRYSGSDVTYVVVTPPR